MIPVYFLKNIPSKKVFLLLFFCIITSNSVSEARESAASDKNDDSVVLQLKWFHQFQFAGYYAALHQGFFQEEGLDVTIKAGGPAVNVDDEVTSGRANYGVLASELIQKKAQGQPLVLLAVIMQHSPRAIIVRADSSINAPTDLIGHRTMLNRNEDTEFMAMFSAEGVAINRLHIIQKDKRANNKFINGEIDALNGSIGNQPFLFQSKGIPVKTIRPISYGIDFYGDSLFTSESELKKHPERVKAFRRATLRGWVYAMEHSSEIIELILSEYHTNKSRDHLRFEVKAMRKLILPELVEIGHVNPLRIERIAQSYAIRNIIPRNFSMENFIYDPSPVSNAKQIRRLIVGFLLFIAIAILGGTILIVFNKRLKKLVGRRTYELDQSNKILVNEVDKRKIAENLANIEKERLAVTLHYIVDGVITTDVEGEIVLINKVTEELTGWSQQEAAGKPILEVFNIINEKTGQPVDNPVDTILATGQIVGLNNHTALITRDSTQYTIEYSGAPIFDQAGRTIGTVIVYRDVTEEIRTAEELVKVNKLKSLGILAGGIAHDFNNILTAILGNIELAQSYTESTNKAYLLLQSAKKASVRAKDLTQQLLTFAKGGDPIKKISSIGKIITDSANFVLRGSSVVCHFGIPENLWNAEVDSGQISQVIQNIIINARDAMPEGGAIEVNCENITNDQNDPKEALPFPAQNQIKITIADSGCGIPEKYLPKIFDPYFSTKELGSGLGLTICHSIISKHGGNISVKSQENRGTIFTIYLPASLHAAQDNETEMPSVVGAEKKATIMIMDDDAMILEMTEQMLILSGHEVLLAENGHEAIDIYNEHYRNNHPIDIIIMDLTIPGGMGGKDAVQEILRINSKAKVVVASGYSNDPVMAHYQDYGFKGAIEKPFNLAGLNKLINSLLA